MQKGRLGEDALKLSLARMQQASQVNAFTLQFQRELETLPQHKDCDRTVVLQRTQHLQSRPQALDSNLYTSVEGMKVGLPAGSLSPKGSLQPKPHNDLGL